MLKNYLYTLILLIGLLIAPTVYAAGPSGQGIFLVSNCSQIANPVLNYTYCFVGPTIALWSNPGPSWNVIGGSSFPLTSNVSGAGYNITNVNLPNSSVNNVLNVMAAPSGALGNGATDDLPAIQDAINTAFGFSANPTGTPQPIASQSVYLPTPPICYNNSAPIRIYGQNLSFYGDGPTSKFCPNYAGDTIIQESWGSPGALPYVASLITGPGNSLVSHTGVISKFIDLNRFLNSTSNTHNLPSAMNAHFNIAFFFDPTDFLGDQILSSVAAYPGTNISGNIGAFKFALGGSNTMAIQITTTAGGGTEHTFPSCPALSSNIVYETELDWDGTTYRAWQGVPGGTAVLCGSYSSTSPLQMSHFEEILLPDGGPTQFWPDGSSNNNNAFDGDIDSIRFETVSEHTSAYTVPTTKFAVDGTTLLLENFPNSLDGTQLAVTSGDSASNNVYFTIFGGAAIGYVAGAHIHDFDLCGSYTGPGDAPIGTGFGKSLTGLYSSGADGSRWENLTCSQAYYLGAEFTEGYDAVLTGWNSFGGHVGLNFNSAWNQSVNRNAGIDGTDTACEVYQGGGGGSHEDYSTRCNDRGGLIYPWIENQSSGNYYYPALDQEASNTAFMAALLLNDPSNPYTVIGGLFSSGNAGVYIQQDNGGFSSDFIGSVFQAPPVGGPAPEVINFTNGSPTSPTQLINTKSPLGVAYSNQLTNVDVLGSFVKTLNGGLNVGLGLAVGGPTGGISTNNINISGAYEINGVPLPSGTTTSFSASAGLIVTNPTSTPNLLIPNNTQYAAGFTGATADVKIAACLAALPVAGGTCDATGLTGSQTLSATVAIPASDTLLLGAATFNGAASPVFTGAKNSNLIGMSQSQLASGGGVTTVNIPSGGVGYQVSGRVGGTTTYGGTVENIAWKGVSDSDGSIGIEMRDAAQWTLENNMIYDTQTGIHYGGDGNCSCYNLSMNNWYGGVTGTSDIGFDYANISSFNQSYLDHAHGALLKGFYIEPSSGAMTLFQPDVESFGAGIALDIAGNGNSIIGYYVEAGSGGTVLQFESAALQNFVLAGFAASVTTSVNYTTADKTTNYVFAPSGTGTGGQPLVPYFSWQGNAYFTVGSDQSYYTLAPDTVASGLLGMAALFTAGRTGETGNGRTGHAEMAVGELTTTGGLADKGLTTTATISAPAGLTCTATCVPGACATTYSYAVVCHDYNGGLTTRSATATCSNNATLDASDYNTLAWTKQDGCYKWDILGNLAVTATSVATNVSVLIPGSVGTPGTAYTYKDTSNSPAAYTVPTRNSTGDLTIASGEGVNYPCVAAASLPAAGTNTAIQNGSTHCVNNWNGTPGACSAETGSPNLSVTATYDTTNSQWDCP